MKILDELRRVRRLFHSTSEIDDLKLQITLLKNRIDCDSVIFDELDTERQTENYAQRYLRSSPLVSVCITTFNRSELLCERSIPSIQSQTYKNLEIIVVGDGCTDDTERRVARITDDRIQFVNAAERGTYPTDPSRRWCVAGTTAVNRALAMATGDFITHLDDDDSHMPDRVETLLAHAQQNRLEMVYHPFLSERPDGEWFTQNADTFTHGSVTTSSIFYDSFFKRIPWDIHAHLLQEPGDWNRLRKFLYLDVRIGRHPGVFLKHYRERNQGG